MRGEESSKYADGGLKGVYGVVGVEAKRSLHPFAGVLDLRGEIHHDGRVQRIHDNPSHAVWSHICAMFGDGGILIKAPGIFFVAIPRCNESVSYSLPPRSPV